MPMADDLQAFIAFAKKRPGQLGYGSSGIGTPYHLAGELFKQMTGTNIVHVSSTPRALRESMLEGNLESRIWKNRSKCASAISIAL
jgi:hypothetical protein